MAANRLLLPIGLVVIVFACSASALLNPCCPGSPYNGEQTKMHMIWFLRDLGGYNRFLTALNDSKVHNDMPRLMSYQQWTFLVPSDRAWKAVPKATMDALKKDVNAYANLMYLHYLPIGVKNYKSLSADAANKKYKNQACNGKGYTTKTDLPATFSAYGGPKAKIVVPNLYMDGVSVQVIDTVLLPGKTGRPTCLNVRPF